MTASVVDPVYGSAYPLCHCPGALSLDTTRCGWDEKASEHSKYSWLRSKQKEGLLMSVAATHTLGFDVSDRYSHYCLIDSGGGILEEGRLKTDEAALTKRFEGSPCRVVMEVGVHSPWMSRLFASMGNEV